MLPELIQPIFTALCHAMNMDPLDPSSSYFFLPMWQSLPQPPVTADVCYFDVAPDPSSHDNYLSETADTLTRVIPLTLRLCIYGPNAEAHAAQLRTSFMSDLSCPNPRHTLRSVSLIPIPDIPEPVTLHEQEGSLWRTRCDLTVRLRYLTHMKTRPDPIEVPPSMTIV